MRLPRRAAGREPDPGSAPPTESTIPTAEANDAAADATKHNVNTTPNGQKQNYRSHNAGPKQQSPEPTQLRLSQLEQR